jgi:rhodopsin domain-containing protein
MGYFLFITTVLSTFIEGLVALLPLPVILMMRMDKKARWGVISVLCLGILTTITGWVRTYTIYNMFWGPDDIVWWSGPQWLTCEVENSVALVSISLL